MTKFLIKGKNMPAIEEDLDLARKLYLRVFDSLSSKRPDLVSLGEETLVTKHKLAEAVFADKLRVKIGVAK